MHAKGLRRVSVSEPSKGRGGAVRRSGGGGGSGIATVRVSACERESVCEGWRGEERRGRRGRTPGRRGGSRGANPASLLRCRRSGRRGRYSPERSERWIHKGSLFRSEGGRLRKP
ncbi:hypothetical protein D4764_13G0010970 [Takifugu flavidus]|uniref:Uncharacterized protein n=1 Tax=Takifugu flavidus TaxID=433684 RepID=A0A5C6PAI3_9TELE|nr:hypothetical protein D4764_13G0010970 [Takifugu flavidus]